MSEPATIDYADSTAPTVASVVRATPTAERTNADTLAWTVTFSEAVTVGAGAFATSPALTGATVTATATGTAPAATWTVQASGGTALAGRDGAVALALANASLITDAADNALTGALPSGAETFTLDNTRPAVASVERHDGTNAQAEHTNADSLTFRVTFSEAVQNVTTADFAASGTTATASAATVVTGNDAQYNRDRERRRPRGLQRRGGPRLRHGPGHRRRGRQHARRRPAGGDGTTRPTWSATPRRR